MEVFLSAKMLLSFMSSIIPARYLLIPYCIDESDSYFISSTSEGKTSTTRSEKKPVPVIQHPKADSQELAASVRPIMINLCVR